MTDARVTEGDALAAGKGAVDARATEGDVLAAGKGAVDARVTYATVLVLGNAAGGPHSGLFSQLSPTFGLPQKRYVFVAKGAAAVVAGNHVRGFAVNVGRMMSVQ